MADIGELVVRIKADAAQLERELRKANGVVQSSAGQMRSSLQALHTQFKDLLPALTVGALAAFGTQAFREADRINDLAQRIGFLGSTLSALNIPLKQGGSNLDEFAASMNRMNAMVGEAAKGTNQEAVKAFDSLGLSVRKLQAMSPEQQFYAIATALSEQDTQAKMTEKGMNIFGRSFSTLIPLIIAAKGDLKGFTEAAKKAGDALTDEQLGKIDEFGDKWTAAVEKLKTAMANAVPGLQLYLDGLAGIVNLPANAFQAGRDLVTASGLAPNPRVSATRPASVTTATTGDAARTAIAAALAARGLKPAANPAAGSNAGLLKGDGGAKEMAKDYDDLTGTLDEYVAKQEREYELLGMTEKQREGMQAVYEAQNLAIKEKNALAPEEIAKIRERAEATHDLKESMAEAARFSAELKDKLSGALTEIAFGFDSAGDAAKRFAESIARAMFEKKISGPLSDALVGTGSRSGLLDDVLGGAGKLFGGFFAAGGNPPVGRPSIVGENGPEIFGPRTAGTVLPNGTGMGGQSVSVVHNWQIGGGVTREELYALVPAIEARTRASVFGAIGKGGVESQMVGRRT